MPRFSFIPKASDAPQIAILVIAIVAAYFAGLLVLKVGPAFAGGWLPAGIGLGALIIGNTRLWPGVALGTYCAVRLTAVPLDLSLLIAVVNTVAVIAGTMIFRSGGFRTALDRFRDVVMLMGVAIPVTGVLSSLLGAAAIHLTGFGADWTFLGIASVWWQGYLISGFIAAPLIISWSDGSVGSLSKPRRVELAGLLLLTLILAVLAVTPELPYPAQMGLVGACFPLVVWSSVRFDLRVTTLIVLAVIGAAMAAGAKGMGPLGMLQKDDQWSALCVFAFFYSSGALVLSVLIDGRRRVEGALRVTQQRLRDIADSATDFFWETDADHRFTFLSDRLGTLLGGTNRDLLGFRIDEQTLVSPAPTDVRQLMEHLNSRESFRNLRVTMKPRSGGKQLVFALNGRPVFDAAGAFQGYRGTATEISNQLRAEQELVEALQLETVSKLTGGVAHEFNNLLAVIVGNLELSLGMLSLDHRARPAMERAMGASDRAATLISRLLAYSRRQALQPRVTDVNMLIKKLLDVLQHSLDSKIHLHLELSEDAWPVKVDPVQLETAIINLALNAGDAMPDGGELTIETYNASLEHPEECFGGEIVPGDYLTLTVRDTGVGMTGEILEHMFEPFFTTKDVGKGTGLGLSMVHGFVNQSGGHIDVASARGSGTSITLLLPRHLVDVSADAPKVSVLDAEPQTT